jgi:hypothetical protein
MKKAVALSLLLFITLSSRALTVKLKITYNDAPVADCDVTIKQGDISLGQGRTNADGDVEIEVSVLAGSAIDIYGSKKMPDGEKNWDVKGYVQLDEENFYHLEMATLVQKMAKDSGMDEKTIAVMWGLVVSDGSAPAMKIPGFGQ